MPFLPLLPLVLFAAPSTESPVVLGSLEGDGLDQSVVYSADGTRIAASGREGVAVMDARTGAVIRSVHAPCFFKIGLTPKGDALACASRVIDVASGNEDDANTGYRTSGASSEPAVAARSADGKVVVRIVGLDPHLEVRGRTPVVLHTARAKRPRGAGDESSEQWELQRQTSLSNDGRYVLIGSNAGTSVFRVRDGALAGVVARDLNGPHDDGGGVLVATAPSGLVIYDLATATERRRIEIPVRPGTTFRGQIAVTPDGKKAAALDGNDLYVVDLVAGELLRSVRLARVGAAAHIALSPDASVLAVASVSVPVKRYSTTTGLALGMPGRHGGAVTAAAFSPSGKRLATVCDDGVRVWSAEDGSVVHYEPLLGMGTPSMPNEHTVLVVSSAVGRLLEGDGGVWTATGTTTAPRYGVGRALHDGKSAWIAAQNSPTGALVRVDVATGASLSTLDRPGYDTGRSAFDVDDKDHIAYYRRGSIFFGAPGGVKELRLRPLEKSEREPFLDDRVSDFAVSGDGAWAGVHRGYRTSTIALVATNTGKELDVDGVSFAFVPHAPRAVVLDNGELRVLHLGDGKLLASTHVDPALRILAAAGDRVALVNGLQVLVVPLPH